MMESTHDTTTAAKQEDEIVQTSLRVPRSINDTVAKLAIDKRCAAQKIWLEAMRQYLALPPEIDAA